MAALPQSQAVTGELTESNEGLMRVVEGVRTRGVLLHSSSDPPANLSSSPRRRKVSQSVRDNAKAMARRLVMVCVGVERVRQVRF